MPPLMFPSKLLFLQVGEKHQLTHLEMRFLAQIPEIHRLIAMVLVCILNYLVVMPLNLVLLVKNHRVVILHINAHITTCPLVKLARCHRKMIP